MAAEASDEMPEVVAPVHDSPAVALSEHEVAAAEHHLAALEAEDEMDSVQAAIARELDSSPEGEAARRAHRRLELPHTKAEAETLRAELALSNAEDHVAASEERRVQRELDATRAEVERLRSPEV